MPTPPQEREDLKDDLKMYDFWLDDATLHKPGIELEVKRVYQTGLLVRVVLGRVDE